MLPFMSDNFNSNDIEYLTKTLYNNNYKIKHVEEVVNRVKLVYKYDPDYDNLISVAWLHDTLENNLTTIQTLKNLNINPYIITSVIAISKLSHTIPYMRYLKTVIKYKLASLVKIQDMITNLNSYDSHEMMIKYVNGLKFVLENSQYTKETNSIQPYWEDDIQIYENSKKLC